VEDDLFGWDHQAATWLRIRSTYPVFETRKVRERRPTQGMKAKETAAAGISPQPSLYLHSWEIRGAPVTPDQMQNH